MKLRHVPIKHAKAFIAEHHRTHKRVAGLIVCVGCVKGDELVGVAAIGRPCRALQDGYTADIVRVCVKPGHRNVNSWLYARAKRLAQAMGFIRIRSYTMPGESGATLRAIGAQHAGMTKGGGYSRPNRPRQDLSPTCPKHRWNIT